MIYLNNSQINDWNFDNAYINKVYYGVRPEPSYTQYEYVQGNGTSYIITDYYVNDNTWAEVDIEGRKATSSTVSAGEAHPFGSCHNINGQASHRFKWLYPGSTIFGSGGMRFDYKGLTAVTRGDSIILSRGIVKIDSSGGYIDDTKLVSFSDQSSTSFDGNMCPIGIFLNLEYNGTTIQPLVGSIAYNGKIYSVKIYEGNTLVRNYVPAIKDGVAGMFETITGVMYGSAVSTPFTVGGEATEIGGTNGNVVYQKITTGDSPTPPTPTGTIWLDPPSIRDQNAIYNVGFYWGEGYKMVINTYLSGSFSVNASIMSNDPHHSPIDFVYYNNGFYLDLHDPLSTSSPDVYTGDYSYRITKSRTLSNYENGQIMNTIITYGTVRVELEETGAAIVTASTNTGGAKNWYNGLYDINIRISSPSTTAHLSGIKVYNANDELVNDLKFIKNDGVVGAQEISMYDSVLGVTYNNTTEYTPSYHIVTP